MQRAMGVWAAGRRTWRPSAAGLDRIAAVTGMAALAAIAIDWTRETPVIGAVPGNPIERASDKAPASSAASGRSTAGRRGEVLAGGYLGVTHTHPSVVTVKNPGRTDMSLGPIEWEGKPFKSPIYYGLRVSHWGEGARVGTLLDFTHAKAIARFDEETSFKGTLEGKPLPPRAKVGDVFKHLEFSHGHNMLTLNGLLRLGSFRLQPYVGAGGGISLPHTEIGYRGEPGRTYEYQYAGLVGQVLAGLEVQVGGARIFVEYKFSYAPYDVPLSGVVNGWILFTDLWRQTSAWARGEAPPGGRLTTPLLSHHAIGGAMVRVTGARAAAAQ
jgi:lipid A oxidase